MAAGVFAYLVSAALFLLLMVGTSVQSPAQPLAAAAPGVPATQRASTAAGVNTTSNTRSESVPADANAQPAYTLNPEPSRTNPLTHSSAICPILEEVAHQNALPLFFLPD